jgi:hypothetical protein
MIIKPLGPEVSIATANTVVSTNANSVTGTMLVRVINTGPTAVLHVAANTGTEYANLSISNSEYVVIEKQKTDTLTGANMLAVPVAQRS